jgi:hypothetical protein
VRPATRIGDRTSGLLTRSGRWAVAKFRDLLKELLVQEFDRTADEVDALIEKHRDIVGNGVSGGRAALNDTARAIVAKEDGQG